MFVKRPEHHDAGWKFLSETESTASQPAGTKNESGQRSAASVESGHSVVVKGKVSYADLAFA